MGPKLPKRTNSFDASMPMLIPCLPSVVFVALPMPMCLCLCRFCVCQQHVCDNAYASAHMPLCLCLCSHACAGAAFASYLLWGHPKLHGMPVVMAKQIVFGVDAATLARPMPMPMSMPMPMPVPMRMPMRCSCLPFPLPQTQRNQ